MVYGILTAFVAVAGRRYTYTVCTYLLGGSIETFGMCTATVHGFSRKESRQRGQARNHSTAFGTSKLNQ